MNGFSISWSYIVQKMEEKFGITPNSHVKYSFYEIKSFLNDIWDQYADEVMWCYKNEPSTSTTSYSSTIPLYEYEKGEKS